MYEVYVLVEKQKSMLLKFTAICATVGTGICLLAAAFMPPFLPVCILFGALAFVLTRRTIEYEYSYFDGELRFTKIISKSRRKPIKKYLMDYVQTIAPIEDRSLHNSLKNPNIKVRDLTSGDKSAKVYGILINIEEGQELIKFEPDEKILDAICMKYGQKVIR